MHRSLMGLRLLKARTEPEGGLFSKAVSGWQKGGNALNSDVQRFCQKSGGNTKFLVLHHILSQSKQTRSYFKWGEASPEIGTQKYVYNLLEEKSHTHNSGDNSGILPKMCQEFRLNFLHNFKMYDTLIIHSTRST